jgi:pyrroline-5-carboxylate reductase
MSLQKRIGFIGVGRMGDALVRSLIGRHLASPDTITVTDKEEGRLANLAELGVGVAKRNVDAARVADAVIIAVKPNDVGTVLEEIRPVITDKLVISIAAGVPTSRIAASLPDARVIRVMPNTPALLGEGAAAFCLGQGATSDDADLVETILSAVGISFRVDEKLMDAVTGVSGSGPAYFYQVVDAIAKEGARQGLPNHIALRLAAQTAVGAGKMILETGMSPEELTVMVASPGGTTVEGLKVLTEGGVHRLFADAVKAAAEKSKQLGRQK